MVIWHCHLSIKHDLFKQTTEITEVKIKKRRYKLMYFNNSKPIMYDYRKISLKLFFSVSSASSVVRYSLNDA